MPRRNNPSASLADSCINLLASATDHSRMEWYVRLSEQYMRPCLASSPHQVIQTYPHSVLDLFRNDDVIQRRLPLSSTTAVAVIIAVAVGHIFGFETARRLCFASVERSADAKTYFTSLDRSDQQSWSRTLCVASAHCTIQRGIWGHWCTTWRGARWSFVLVANIHPGNFRIIMAMARSGQYQQQLKMCILPYSIFRFYVDPSTHPF